MTKELSRRGAVTLIVGGAAAIPTAVVAPRPATAKSPPEHVTASETVPDCATIEDVKCWLERLIDPSGVKARLDHLRPWNDYLTVVTDDLSTDDAGLGERRYEVELTTFAHCYRIKAVERCGRGYLGCVASTLRPREDESFCRGNDLSDGALTAETWGNIVADIIAYELMPPGVLTDDAARYTLTLPIRVRYRGGAS